MAITLPVNPSTSSASVGKDYLLYINTGSAQAPTWTLIGGQRSADLSRNADSIDVSHKTSGGWKSNKAGLRGWSIDLDALVLLSDAALPYLEKAFNDGAEINVRMKYPDGTLQSGWGSLTDFSLATPHDGEASITGTIEGNGALSDRAPGLSPLSAAGDKSDPVDIAFAITPTTTTVSSVKIDGAALTSVTDYTYSAGALNIESNVIGALTIGAHTLSVITGDGATLSAIINVEA